MVQDGARTTSMKGFCQARLQGGRPGRTSRPPSAPATNKRLAGERRWKLDATPDGRAHGKRGGRFDPPSRRGGHTRRPNRPTLVTGPRTLFFSDASWRLSLDFSTTISTGAWPMSTGPTKNSTQPETRPPLATSAGGRSSKGTAWASFAHSTVATTGLTRHAWLRPGVTVCAVQVTGGGIGRVHE